MSTAADFGPLDQIEVFLQDKESYSYSALNHFDMCRRMFHIERDLRRGSAAPNARMDAGTVIHEGLAAFYRTGNVESGLAALEETYDRLFAWVIPGTTKLGNQYTKDNLIDVFLGYFNHWKNDHFDVEPTMVEVGTLVKIRDFYYVARMDLVPRMRSSRKLFPVDHKTTGSMYGNYIDNFYPDNQTTSYLYSIRSIVGPEESVLTCVINAILINVNKREYSRPGIVRTPRDLDEWETEVCDRVDEIRRRRDNGIWPKSTGACYNCGFTEICNTHENPAVVNSFPERSTRNPFHF